MEKVNSYVRKICRYYTKITFDQFETHYGIEPINYRKKRTIVMNVEDASPFFFGEEFITIPLNIPIVTKNLQISHPEGSYCFVTQDVEKKSDVSEICKRVMSVVKRCAKLGDVTDAELKEYCLLSSCLLFTLVGGLCEGLIPFGRCMCLKNMYLHRKLYDSKVFYPVCENRCIQSDPVYFSDQEIFTMVRSLLNCHGPDSCLYVACCKIGRASCRERV